MSQNIAHAPWSRIQEPLVSFLETIVDLPGTVRSAGREVADLYGRYNPDKFRAVWERLGTETNGWSNDIAPEHRGRG